jgi:hypothetical protein
LPKLKSPARGPDRGDEKSALMKAAQPLTDPSNDC